MLSIKCTGRSVVKCVLSIYRALVQSLYYRVKVEAAESGSPIYIFVWKAAFLLLHHPKVIPVA